MSPHPALQCFDILENIFQQLRFSPGASMYDPPSETDRMKRKALANCARVCRVFSDLALIILWERLDSLLPALKLLPSFDVVSGNSACSADGESLYIESISEDDHYAYVLDTGQIWEAEWRRFQRYAGHVLSLTHTTGNRPETQSAVLEQLSLHNGGQPLFPSLQRLKWTLYSPFDRTILFLVPSSLRDLAIHKGILYYDDISDGDDVAFGDLLGAICTRAALQTILTPDIAHPISLMPICSNDNLTKIDIRPSFLSIPLLKGLASLPHLTDLKTCIPGPTGDVPCVGFKRVQNLELRGNRDCVMYFLSLVLSPVLSTVSIHLIGSANAPMLSPLTSVISLKFPYLQSIGISTQSPSGTDNSSFTTAFGPLMSLRRLQKFNLLVLETFSLSTEEVIEMASAWPHIQEVSIHFPYHLGIQTPVDAGCALAAFARLCPELAKLRLPYMDFGALLPSASILSLHAVRHHLLSLDFDVCSNLTIADPTAVARALDIMFPYLDLDHAIDQNCWITEALYPPPALEPQWMKVLMHMAAIRQEKDQQPEQVGDSLLVKAAV